jgi:predicted nucleic acid-binding protein
MNEFLDTNILVYAHDAGALHKYGASVDLISRLANDGSGAVSVQVLVEFYNVALRKLRMKSETAEAVIGDFADWQLHCPNHTSVISAVRLQRRYQLSWYDATILNSALESGCSILWTEDFHDGQRFGDLIIRNPYKSVRSV